MGCLTPKSILIPIDHATINAWVPLAFAVNCLNRSTEQPDLYPFVLSQEVIEKLGYVDALVHDRLTAVSDRETLTQAGWGSHKVPSSRLTASLFQ
jgi:hypothetical protein